jgi:glycosyltransferase involved in cell wall biosynthesis
MNRAGLPGGRNLRWNAALIIPALNEELVLANTLDAIPDDWFRQVIVADNGSDDATPRIALEFGTTLSVETQRGYGATCLKAIQALAPDVEAVVFMQSDGSEDVAEVDRLLEPIFQGSSDLVIGSRILGEALPGSLTVPQRFGNWIATQLIAWRFGKKFTDIGPFRAISVGALKKLDMQDRTWGWTVEMQAKSVARGLRVMEVPVTYRIRKAGYNKVSGVLLTSIRAGIKIIATVLTAR